MVVKELDLDANERNANERYGNERDTTLMKTMLADSPILQTLEDCAFILKCMNKTPDFTNVKKIY